MFSVKKVSRHQLNNLVSWLRMAGAQSFSERLSRTPPEDRLAPRDYIAANQRARIHLALAELVAERGYQKVTIELLTKTARVSLATFYENFASKEECFLAAFDADVEAAAEVFDDLLDPAQPWPDQIVVGLETFLELVLAEPARARLCLVAAKAAGVAAFARYQAMLESVAPKLREGRELSPRAERLPDGLEVGIAGGIAWVVYQRLVNGKAEELRALLPEIVQLTLTPYIGEQEARRTAQTSTAKGVAAPRLRQGGQAEMT